jgi:hypothetical protein
MSRLCRNSSECACMRCMRRFGYRAASVGSYEGVQLVRHAMAAEGTLIPCKRGQARFQSGLVPMSATEAQAHPERVVAFLVSDDVLRALREQAAAKGDAFLVDADALEER